MSPLLFIAVIAHQVRKLYRVLHGVLEAMGFDLTNLMGIKIIYINVVSQLNINCGQSLSGLPTACLHSMHACMCMFYLLNSALVSGTYPYNSSSIVAWLSFAWTGGLQEKRSETFTIYTDHGIATIRHAVEQSYN